MNLMQTINELEQKAAEYTQAADSLRALLSYEESDRNSGRQNGNQAGAKAGTKSQSTSGVHKQASPKKSAGKKAAGKRSAVSPETRAKISAAIKARHQQKKNQAA